MKVQVFSDTKTIENIFAKINKVKDLTIEFHPCSNLRKVVKDAEKGSFIYYDINKHEEKEYNKTIKYLSKLEFQNFGIIDPKGSISDISALFFDGASDYLGKILCKEEITPKRLNTALSFKKIDLPEESISTIDKSHYILSGNDWKGIKSGQEYTFCFMFIEIDNKKEIKKIFGGEQINDFLTQFQNYINTTVAGINGKIWMWHDFGGLILFPFNGEDCDAILTSIRLMLNRNITSAENFEIDLFLSFRIALHIGNTVYKKRGDTGKIVSDSINSIFHLGQKFTDAGGLTMTQDVIEYIPKSLSKLFLSAGEFEGREIHRMRRQIYNT